MSMRTAEEMADYVQHHRFAHNDLPEEKHFTPVERILRPDERVLVAWLAGSVFENIYTCEMVFESEAAFAFTDQRLIVSGDGRIFDCPLKDFNGIFVTVSDTDYGDEMLLAVKNRLMIFTADEMLSTRLVRTVNGYLDMLHGKIAAEFDEVRCLGKPNINIS